MSWEVAIGTTKVPKKEQNTNGLDESRSRKRHKLTSEDTVKGGALLDTPEKSTSTHEQQYQETHQRHHHHHLGKRREK